jgi:hypothetical protein
MNNGAEYSFIEYSYNEDVISTDVIEQKITDLGFTKRTRNEEGSICLWTQHLCILVVRNTKNVLEPGITGIGVSCSTEIITSIGAQYEMESGMYVYPLGERNRILMMPHNEFEDMKKALAKTINLRKENKNNGLNFVSGLIYNNVDPRMMDVFQDIGFKFTRSTDNYNVLMSSSNRFSLICNKNNDDKTFQTIICDTDDVFHTTACMTSLKVKMKKFKIDKSKLNFDKLNHKIVGYNCHAVGNTDSYTIENFAIDAVPNLDLIFRQRKQYLHIREDTLGFYYEDEKK